MAIPDRNQTTHRHPDVMTVGDRIPHKRSRPTQLLGKDGPFRDQPRIACAGSAREADIAGYTDARTPVTAPAMTPTVTASNARTGVHPCCRQNARSAIIPAAPPANPPPVPTSRPSSTNIRPILARPAPIARRSAISGLRVWTVRYMEVAELTQANASRTQERRPMNALKSVVIPLLNDRRSATVLTVKYSG